MIMEKLARQEKMELQYVNVYDETGTVYCLL